MFKLKNNEVSLCFRYNLNDLNLGPNILSYENKRICSFVGDSEIVLCTIVNFYHKRIHLNLILKITTYYNDTDPSGMNRD